MRKTTNYLKNIFSELGFSEESGVFYYEALKLGKATVQDISRASNLPRSSCYDILDRLKREGFVSTISEKGTTYVVAEQPDMLAARLKKIQEKKKEALKNFEEISNHLSILGKRRGGDQPDVRLYEGFESMKKVLLDVLKECDKKGLEMVNVCQGEADKFAGLSRDPDYLKEYIAIRNKMKIKERAIMEDVKSAREYKERYETRNYQMLLSPQLSRKDTAHIDKIVFGDTLLILNFEKDYAVVIKDRYIAENEKISFEVMWNALMQGSYKY
ncbi:MAG: helix-turn-helix domain-containing protein [Candidatus Dojkabacteria bacterium]|nr:helix-turn-helix domain-containing protein [Candidatus Dojkabacteria bacterium]